MKIQALISNCCEASIIEETDICSRCKEHCEPQTENQCYKLSGKIKDKYRLLKIITENYNLGKNGCFLPNRKLAAYLAIEKFAEDGGDMKVEAISRLLGALVKKKEIRIIHFGGKNGKRIILANKVSQNEATKIFVEKHKEIA